MEQKYNSGWTKTKITQVLMDQLGIEETKFSKYFRVWWYNQRNDLKSFRLTDSGLAAFSICKIESYVISLTKDTIFTNKLILSLDNFINGPYYLETKKLTVFDQSMAVQLMLFAGDVKKYSDARDKSIKVVDKNSE